ncbi:MAG: aminotransferase class I/II-fold pyridoxal phosphate-dependent enzyme [Methyloligellaceae bacterium]
MSPATAAIAQNLTPVSPFARLAELLDGLEPGGPVIDLTVGEPRHPMPEFLMDGLAEAQADFSKYPPIRGTDEFRSAVAKWLGRRYRPLKGLGEWALGVIPLSGTREGLFHVVFSATARRPDIKHPAILLPNPFYHTYAAAAGASGAEPVFLAAGADTGYLPALDAIGDDMLTRTVAFFLCSPANPQGAVADTPYLERAIELARKHDFLLIADECYSEIYTQNPPPGALETAWQLGDGLGNVISMQSLSKRSNLPGLRAGFCAGDPDFIEAFATFRNVVAPQMPLPVQHVCALVLGDEAHVEASRALYAKKFDASDRILAGKFGYRRPDGGFFLWLDVSGHGGCEQAVKTLWKGCGVKLLPGRYLAHDDADGTNPGAGYVRLAMVQDLAATGDALNRMAETLK